MALFDLPLEQLQSYRANEDAPADFAAFWDATLAEAAAWPLDVSFAPVDYGLRTVDTFDVSFRGYGGQLIKAWLMVPRHRDGPLPCVVEYIGYGGGRGFPSDWLLWSSAGFAHFVMDTRGQGSEWLKGDTPDVEAAGSNPQYPGFLTRGVLARETYYYRRVFADAVRAVAAAQAHPGVDPTRLAVTGASQGGGIALAVSGLVPGVGALLADVPFLCHYRRATEITDAAPYSELTHFCAVHRDRVEQVFATLAYFDGVHFAARSTAPALFSVALMDQICPPSTVFAAYNVYAGPKAIKVWPYNGHNGGGPYQQVEKVRFLQAQWPA